VLQRELAYSCALIAKAPRNESAWNYLLGLFALPGCAKHEMAGWPQVRMWIGAPPISGIVGHTEPCTRALTAQAIALRQGTPSCSFRAASRQLPGSFRATFCLQTTAPPLSDWAPFPPQVHQACLDALAAVPSCPPALWALADYYACVAEAAAEHVRQVHARGRAQDKTADLGPGVYALHAAVNNASLLLDGLTMADPIRSMYWVHRHQQLQRLAAGWPAPDAGEGGGGDAVGAAAPAAAGAAAAGDAMQD
jgi:hypothetical protein